MFSRNSGDLAIPFFGRHTDGAGFTVEQDMLIGTVEAGRVYQIPVY